MTIKKTNLLFCKYNLDDKRPNIFFIKLGKGLNPQLPTTWCV